MPQSDAPLRPSERDVLHVLAQRLRDRPRDTCQDHGADVMWRAGLARQIDAVADGRIFAKGGSR